VNDQSPLTLLSFVRRFEAYRNDEREEGENPLADVKYDAVKVMTIHKAKGLDSRCVSAEPSAPRRRDRRKARWERRIGAAAAWSPAAQGKKDQRRDGFDSRRNGAPRGARKCACSMLRPPEQKEGDSVFFNLAKDGPANFRDISSKRALGLPAKKRLSTLTA